MKNDAAKLRKMNEFFAVDISAQQQNERHSDRPKPTTPEPPSPSENPVEIQNNGPNILWLTGFGSMQLVLIEKWAVYL